MIISCFFFFCLYSPCLWQTYFKCSGGRKIWNRYRLWRCDDPMMPHFGYFVFCNLLLSMTCSRGIHNDSYYNRMPYTSSCGNLGHILQLLRLHWRVDVGQWLQSNCESPGGVMKRLVIYCSSLPQMPSYTGYLPQMCLHEEGTGQQLPRGPVCPVILLWHKNKNLKCPKWLETGLRILCKGFDCK